MCEGDTMETEHMNGGIGEEGWHRHKYTGWQLLLLTEMMMVLTMLFARVIKYSL